MQLACIKQKAEVAKLITERSLLKEKVKLQAPKEHLQIDREIAKAKVREQEFEELEREQKLKLPEVDNETHDSFLALPTPTTGANTNSHRYLAILRFTPPVPKQNVKKENSHRSTKKNLSLITVPFLLKQRKMSHI